MPAAAILEAVGDETLDAVASGELRPAYVPARPPGGQDEVWTVDGRLGFGRADAPEAAIDGGWVTLEGEVAFVPDAPGAELLVAIAAGDDGEPVAAAVQSSQRKRSGASRWFATTRPAHWLTSPSPAPAGAGSMSILAC